MMEVGIARSGGGGSSTDVICFMAQKYFVESVVGHWNFEINPGWLCLQSKFELASQLRGSSNKKTRLPRIWHSTGFLKLLKGNLAKSVLGSP
ncbi:hypothetical protein C5167_015757 [Papaver somniferum]|uniref:Uncharacterized protein n=1 Tax=Papaver somniferum TaxID=3469 RepID=A0A4Y7J701_PAPSO|nr:hypothetical protein C5167_015757 [Papaver somniferum]